MGASLVVTARETLEASLIVGILLAYLAQTENRRYFLSVWMGVGLAVIASGLLAAVLLLTVGEFTGMWEEAFEGGVMWTAVGVLTYMLWWMGRQSRSLGTSLRAGAETALVRGSVGAIVSLAFLAVFREGAETALYLSAIASTSSGYGVTVGAGMGFSAAALAGYLIYRGGSR
ncbi:MAG: FTR1 family protein, partial [Chloroflexota bacterium]